MDKQTASDRVERNTIVKLSVLGLVAIAGIVTSVVTGTLMIGVGVPLLSAGLTWCVFQDAEIQMTAIRKS